MRSRWVRLVTTFVAAVSVFAAYQLSQPPTVHAAGYSIGGKILEEYNQAGGRNFFGDAVTPENNAARGGKWQAFQKSSSIYWHPNVSNGHANQIGGDIRTKWGDLGYENGALRYPTTRELSTRVSGGRFNRFEGGNVYYSPDAGTHPVWGAILDKWSAYDYEAGSLGFPTSDEFAAKDGGRGQRFQGGAIYWSSGTGAHVVWGLIGQHWADANYENGDYGYPISDEFADSGYEKGRRQNFQGGVIQAVDMTVPLEGYGGGGGVDLRQRNTAPSQSEVPPTSDPSITTTPSPSPSTGPSSAPSSPVPDSASPSSAQRSAPSSLPETSTAAAAQLMPGNSSLYNSGGALRVTPATFPFGDFCIFGTKNGPGSACRLGGTSNPYSVIVCAGSLAFSAATLVFAAAKILKIREFIKGVGGVKEAYQLWKGAATAEDRSAAWAATGKISKEIAKEFLGIGAIVEGCKAA